MRLSAALWLLSSALLSVRAGGGSEDGPGMFQEFRSTVEELGGQGRTYLGKLAGEQTVLSVQKAFSQVLSVVAQSVASGLNVLLHSMSQLLQAAGLHVRVPATRLTAEGVVFVTQWVLVALVGYWLLSHALHLVTSTLKWLLWLLQAALALACFVYILNDHRVGPETMALRVAALVGVCVLLGVGCSARPSTADKTARLEERLKMLERRLKDMERWVSKED